MRSEMRLKVNEVESKHASFRGRSCDESTLAPMAAKEKVYTI